MPILARTALRVAALAATSLLVLAAPAESCPPKWTKVSGRILTQEGFVDVTIRARPLHTRVHLSAVGVELPQSGAFRVLLAGDFPQQELGSFALTLGQNYEEEYSVDQDMRLFLTGSETLVLMDGATEIGRSEAGIAGGLRLRARQGGGTHEPAYRLRGRLVVREDGTSRFKIEAVAVGAEPDASLTFRIVSPGKTLDMALETDALGNGRRAVRGRDDLLWKALEWEEVIVLLDETVEVARMPLECR